MGYMDAKRLDASHFNGTDIIITKGEKERCRFHSSVCKAGEHW